MGDNGSVAGLDLEDAGAPGTATEVRVLGALRTTIDGRRVDQQLPGRKGRLLFAFMALNRRRTFSRGELIEVLWPGGQPASPDAALSTVLSRLRQAIGEERIHGRAELALLLPADARVDAEIAEERMRAAAEALEAGDAGSALAAARAAADLLADALLPEFGDDWIEDRRRELAEALATSLELLARAALALGPAQVTAARAAARRLIEREPWRESGYALLMQAHARAGDIAEGLRVFERLRVLLRDELGTSPSPAVREIHQQLLSGESTAPAAPVDASVAPAEASAHRRVALPPVLATLARGRFVGRRDELATLGERWRDVATGHDAIVLVSGEAGMGKTVLAAQFAQRVHADGATVLFGQCDEHAMVPYQPLAEALRHYFRDAHGGLPAGTVELGRMFPELRDRLPENRPSVAAEPEAERFRVFEAVRSVVAAAAEDRPVLLVVDDAQWADSSTVLLLRHVIREPDRFRLMVLVTYRGSEVPADHLLHEVLTDLGRTRPIERLALEGLGDEDCVELIGAYAGARPAPSDLRRWRERTEGHPFFLHELLRSADRATVAASPEIDVPVTVRELIARNVSHLDQRSSAALASAAVIGRDFDLDVLTALIGDSTDTTIAALEEAIAHGLIEEVPDRFDRFAFTHALIREVLYEQHSRTRRARLHLRVGELLEHAPAGASPAVLAHHFFEARHLAGADRVVDHCVKAAAMAADALGYEEAAAHYRRALAALDAEGPSVERERCELQLALGEVQWRAGDPEVARTFARAAESARGRGHSGQLARAALGGRNHETGMPDPARVALLEEALAAFRADENPVLRVRVLGRLAEALHFAGADARARATSAEAIDAAQALGDPEAVIAALMGRHAALLHVDHVEERLPLLRDLVILAERTGRPDLAAHGHQWTTYALFELGDLDRVRVEHRTFARVAQELHEPGYAHVALAWRSLLAQLDGDFETAERLAFEGHALAERVRGIDAVALLAAQLYFIRREQGRLEELVPAVEGFVAANEIPTWRAGLTVALASAGQTGRAEASLTTSMAQDLEDLRRDMWWLATMSLLAEGCAALGDAGRAPRLYDVLAPYAARNVQVAFAAHLGSVQRPLGLLAGAMHRWPAATAHFEAALERHAGSRSLTVRTQCDFAEMLARTGRAADARRAAQLVAQAARTAGTGGMRALVDRASERAAEAAAL